MIQIKCQECDAKLPQSINLNSLNVESCPAEYGPILQDVLPTSNLPFVYRLPRGQDEQELIEYRERNNKAWGDSKPDDTLIYRSAMLLENIDGINQRDQLSNILRNLSVNDVSYIRNCTNEPPFGVDTKIEVVCRNCWHEFEVEMPMESNFFFPRRKKVKTQA